MFEPKFWIDFENADLCRADGVAIADMKAEHCDPTPESLQELDKILKTHAHLQGQVRILREALERLQGIGWIHNAAHTSDVEALRGIALAFAKAMNETIIPVLEATKEGA